jgi:hypothetical protein
MSSQIHSAERHRHCHIAIACLRQIRASSSSSQILPGANGIVEY